jgi:hypothetical protein
MHINDADADDDAADDHDDNDEVTRTKRQGCHDQDDVTRMR